MTTADNAHQNHVDSRHILLTGGTGFLGSHLAAELLARGYSVEMLARSDSHLTASQRVERVLDWHGVAPVLQHNAHVVEGDITLPSLNLEDGDRRRLQETVGQIVHCASNTSFIERDREQVVAANVGGLEHVLEFAAESSCTALHHVSTAYVAGRHSGQCYERLDGQRAFYNVYEESKCHGEWLAWERCQATGIRLCIYRPSIVYGHSQTGRALRFNALYYPVRTCVLLKRLYETDIREHGGARAQAVGIRIEPDGRLYLPIRIGAPEQGGLNLIPVDYFVAAFLAIMETPSAQGIYHIVNAQSKPVEELLDYTAKYLGIAGMRACPLSGATLGGRNALEILVDSYLEAYGPYMADTRIFDQSAATPILTHHGIECPTLDYATFARCMNYADQVGWRPAFG